jgi:hypothetical protein
MSHRVQTYRPGFFARLIPHGLNHNRPTLIVSLTERYQPVQDDFITHRANIKGAIIDSHFRLPHS